MIRFRFALICGALLLTGGIMAFWGGLAANRAPVSDPDPPSLTSVTVEEPLPENKPLPPVGAVPLSLPPIIGANAPFPHFRVVVLPGGFSAEALNNKGEVAGAWDTGKETNRGSVSQAVTLAAIWSRNHLRFLPGDNWPICSAMTINDKGFAGGFGGEAPSLSPIDNGSEEAILWYPNGTIRRLPPTYHLGQMGITGINNQEALVGWAYPSTDLYLDTAGYGSGFFSGGKSFVLLGHRVHAINERGEVAGTMKDQIALWQGGQRRLLGRGEAFALNNRGWVVGTQSIGKGGEYSGSDWQTQRAFLYRNTTLFDLGTLPDGDTFSVANGVNDRGQIVGNSARDENVHFYAGRAFLWQNGKMTNLNRLVNSTPGLTLREAKAINNKGQIVAVGTLNGKERSFLLTQDVPKAAR